MNVMTSLASLVQREQYMLTQFCHSLQAVIHRLADKGSISEEAQATLQSQLQGDISWSQANQVELALVDYYDDIMLSAEWQRGLAEIHRLPANLVSFYQEQAQAQSKVIVDAKATDNNTDHTEKLRTLLARLIADLQWQRESKRVIRYHENQMRKNVVAFFLCAFILFFTPTIGRVFFSLEFDNLRVYYIFSAATSGILGAAFSQLTSISSRVQSASLDQVRAMSHFSYIMARSVVGAGAGLIMFYLIQSGLLNGAFFPEFIDNVGELQQFQNELAKSGMTADQVAHGVSQPVESELSIGTLARPAQGLSLLIVWCILAGFSEKLIPGILNKKAEEAANSDKK